MVVVKEGLETLGERKVKAKNGLNGHQSAFILGQNVMIEIEGQLM